MREDKMHSRIQVLVVDDSAVVRQVTQALLSQEPDMVVTVAADPLIALDKMKHTRPHVILLDLEMPRMDGLTFLRKVMAEDPIPTLVCSSVAGRGTETAMRALGEGAVGIVSKPKVGVREFLNESAVMLVDMVRSAAQAKVRRRHGGPVAPVPYPIKRKPVTGNGARPGQRAVGDKIIFIGASTGGTEAVETILTAMPIDAPGIVVVQHMPELFTAAFASRLNDICQIEVKEAADGDLILPGRAFIAPGNRHTAIQRLRGNFAIEILDGPLVSRHRPSVNVLFHSAAANVGPNAVGVMLTGMGNDGSEGMLEMKRAGAVNIAQNEQTCVVFGMPKEAIAIGAVDYIVPLRQIAGQMLRYGRSVEADSPFVRTPR
jgi:two-component system chemotaxis response regulator CheB